jgi:hypothetical protein
MSRAYLVAALAFSVTACKSKEEQACRSQEKWVAELSEALDQPNEPMDKDELAKCIAEHKGYRHQFRLDEAQYEALLDCQIAAPTMDEGLACLGPVLEVLIDARRKDAEAKVERDAEEKLATNKPVPAAPISEQDIEAAVTRLEIHVASGVVTAESLVALREREGVAGRRVIAILDDALGLIEAGRVSAANPLTLKLQPEVVFSPSEGGSGLDAAELRFVEASTGATVGRLGPVTTSDLGPRDSYIAALFDWMIEEPATRRVEIPVNSSMGEDAMPPVLNSAIPAFKAAGIADRPVIWLDGKPWTLDQWAMR